MSNKENMQNELLKIKEEVCVFHGPKDLFHPDAVYEIIIQKIPNGR